MMAPPTPALAQSRMISSTASRAAVMTAQSGTSGRSRDIGIAGLLADRLVARVHRVGAAGVVLHVEQHALAERTGARRRADHRDALRMEQACELFPAVDAGASCFALTRPD